MAARRPVQNPKMRVGYFNNFTGGLNLRSQQQDLQPGETPDCMDMDFDQRGGITLRRGHRNVTTDANMSTTAGYLCGAYSFGTEKLWGVSNVGRLWTWDGATATHVATAITSNTTTEFARGVAVNSKLYFANCYNGGTTLIMRTWNDAAFATLGNTANANYTAPTAGNAPLARLIVDHKGYMWWADTVEAGTRFRYRIRFSHPLQFEDFAPNDYFDIEPDDQTDQITAIVPFAESLLVFKRRSVYAIYGTSRDDFVVEPISVTAGAWSQESVTVSETACYWWSPDGDVMAYNRVSGVVSIGNKISIISTNGTILPGADHRILWAEKRLYLSVLNTDATRTMYVFDPSVGQGAWTRYAVQVSSLVWWRRGTGLNGIMWRVLGKAGVSDFNISTQAQDYDGTTNTPIPGYYRTAWYAADDTALMKRWKRLQFTASCGNVATLNVRVYHDFDGSLAVKTMTLPLQTGSGMLWDSGVWDTGLWGSDQTVFTFDRMQSLGRSHAISLFFQVTGHTTTWTMDSYAIPYLEKAYR